MKVEQPTRTRRPPEPETIAVVGDGAARPRLGGPAGEAAAMLSGGREAWVARSPFVLDFFGGAADFAGSLVLLVPLADHACVAVECREDGTLRVARAGADGGRRVEVVIPEAAALGAVPGGNLARSRARDLGCEDAVLLAMIGAVVEGARAGAVQIPLGGLSLAATATTFSGPVTGPLPAIVGAALRALARMQGVVPPNELLLSAGQRVLRDWLGFTLGSSLVAGLLCGDSRTMVRVCGEPCVMVDAVGLPEGVTFAAVDCGAFDEDWRARCLQVRSATAMGQTLIERIVAHERIAGLDGRGVLSRIGVDDYVRRFRDRLPTKLRGREFLDRYGAPEDASAVIEPKGIYKVRSRTEHHIYEHARAVQLTTCLERIAEGGAVAARQQIAELFAASHWSYGQRCGLGSKETDLLVRSLSGGPSGEAVIGAKVCGQGCGGVVGMLLGDRASSEALQAGVRAYENRTGRTARWMGPASGEDRLNDAVRIAP